MVQTRHVSSKLRDRDHDDLDIVEFASNEVSSDDQADAEEDLIFRGALMNISLTTF